MLSSFRYGPLFPVRALCTDGKRGLKTKVDVGEQRSRHLWSGVLILRIRDSFLLICKVWEFCKDF